MKNYLKFIYVLFILTLSLTSCDNKKDNKNINKESKKVVMLIYGNPACGKLTTAKEVAKKYNLNLVDNHFFNNIIFPYVVLNTPNVIAMYPDIHKIKKIWFDNVVKYGKNDKGFIFTDVLIDLESTRKDVKNLMLFANQIGYKFVPIKLICDDNTIKSRINSFERKKKHKMTDFKAWKEYVEKTKFLDVKDSLVIKNDNLNQTLENIDQILR